MDELTLRYNTTMCRTESTGLLKHVQMGMDLRWMAWGGEVDISSRQRSSVGVEPPPLPSHTTSTTCESPLVPPSPSPTPTPSTAEKGTHLTHPGFALGRTACSPLAGRWERDRPWHDCPLTAAHCCCQNAREWSWWADFQAKLSNSQRLLHRRASRQTQTQRRRFPNQSPAGEGR